jgi:hypothetical protein
MTTPANIQWGSYKEFEGPFFRGTQKFKLPDNPTESQRVVGVITATEGGSYDAMNLYDRCIISTGLLQWCEANYFLTSSLLGAILQKQSSLMSHLQPALDASNATFRLKSGDKWRFYIGKTDPEEVDTLPEQQRLFLLNSDGHLGTWDDASKQHAKLWASCVANLLAEPAAQAIQIDYTAARVRMFASTQAKEILFNDPTPSESWCGAMRAGYLSFAANLPAVASRHLIKAVSATTATKWSPDWCCAVFRELTFGPGIAIYPHRYKAIRPVVEQLYSVDLPDMAEDLKNWKSGLAQTADLSEGAPDFTEPREIQRLLIALKYDLGPSGADGVFGKKSREALSTFQRLNGLTADGMPGSNTRVKLIASWGKLSAEELAVGL